MTKRTPARRADVRLSNLVLHGGKSKHYPTIVPGRDDQHEAENGRAKLSTERTPQPPDAKPESEG